MEDIIYSLWKQNNSEEIHIFEGKLLLANDNCTAKPNSICQAKNWKTSEGDFIHECLNENKARLKCATIGRKVCGTCVSRLYSSYQ